MIKISKSGLGKPRKEKREEGRKGKGSRHRVKHPTPFQATDALTGDEEQNRKQKSEETERDRGIEGETPNPIPGN